MLTFRRAVIVMSLLTLCNSLAFTLPTSTSAQAAAYAEPVEILAATSHSNGEVTDDPTMSDNGQLVGFNVPLKSILADTATGSQSRVLGPTGADAAHAAVSADGRLLTLSDRVDDSRGDGRSEVFQRNLQSGGSVQISPSSPSTYDDGDSALSAQSADGRYVFYQTVVAIPGGGNFYGWMFDTLGGQREMATVDPTGQALPMGSLHPWHISGNGRFFVFAGYPGGVRPSNLYLRDVVSNVTTVIPASLDIDTNGIIGITDAGSVFFTVYPEVTMEFRRATGESVPVDLPPDHALQAVSPSGQYQLREHLDPDCSSFYPVKEWAVFDTLAESEELLPTAEACSGHDTQQPVMSNSGNVLRVPYRYRGLDEVLLMFDRGGEQNAGPVWEDSTVQDGARYDLVNGQSQTFILSALDPDDDALTLQLAYSSVSGAPISPPAFMSCREQINQPGALRVDCRVAPTTRRTGLALLRATALDTSGEATTTRTLLVGGSPLQYVALGDSYSAGEGVDPYFRDGYRQGHTGPLDNRCHRSSRSFAEQVVMPGSADPAYVVASGGGDPGQDPSNVNKYGSDSNIRYGSGQNWLFWACSGATTRNVLPASEGGVTQNYGGYRERYPQLDNPTIDYATDLVTITIGGNDIGFADVLQHCALRSCNNPRFEQQLDAMIDAVQPGLEAVYAAILAKTFNATVLVMGYPQLFPSSVAEQSCSKLRPWSGEQDLLRRATDRLNGVIAGAAAAAGVTFVDAAPYFEDHEVCGISGEWINGPSFTFKTGRWFLDDESFHPNLVGQFEAGYADAVNDAV